MSSLIINRNTSNVARLVALCGSSPVGQHGKDISEPQVPPNDQNDQ